MAAIRAFDIVDVLTITTGRRLNPAPDGVNGALRLMAHLFGGEVWLHQFARLEEPARTELLRQHPQLAAETGDDVSLETYPAWRRRIVGAYGETRDVAPLEDGRRYLADPVRGGLAMGGPVAVVTPRATDTQH